MTKSKKLNYNKEEIMKRHDFNYIREHFYDRSYTINDVRKDITEVYGDELGLSQLSADGKNTVRVTNYFVMETQSKATSIRAKMSPHRAINDDDALCELFNKIDTHPRFFNIRKDMEERLISEGLISLEPDELKLYNEGKLNLREYLLNTKIPDETDFRREGIIENRDNLLEQLNMADLREVRRAVAHTPAFHRVSQFPNHVAQRIYERYAPIKGGIILDSSCGWGNRLMATMSSKYGYKYLGTDPNSEMHPNYYALAKTIYETVYYGKDSGLDSQGNVREFPKDFFDIRDQGSEFDIPEWHNFSGYIASKDNPNILINAFTNASYTLPDKLELNKEYTAWEVTHPADSGKGCCDTGTLNTTGAKLPPIYQTHDELIFYSGIGDLSFTSPPYFFLECYTEDSQKGDLSTGQSAGKGAKYTDWIKNFVYPTIVNHFNYLKPGGYYIYNLKDLPKDNLYLYSDWLSACLDVGFELIEQPEMLLKSRRQFGKKASNDDPSGLSEAIDFNGATERVAVLRKPLNPTDEIFKPDNIQALYHVQRNFNYPLLSACRPAEFTSKLPTYIEEYLKDKFKNKKSKFIK